MDSPMPSMPNLNPQMPSSQMQAPRNSHTGLLIVVSLLVVLALAAGAYYWMFMLNKAPAGGTPQAGTENQEAETPPVADSSRAIDAELGSTEDINLDAEFEDIDKDLQSL